MHPSAGCVRVEALSLWRRADFGARRGEPSAGIVRVDVLSLWRRANFRVRRLYLCGDRACRNALAVALYEFSTLPARRGAIQI